MPNYLVNTRNLKNKDGGTDGKKTSRVTLILRNNSCLLYTLVFLFYIWNLRLLVGINLKHK